MPTCVNVCILFKHNTANAQFSCKPDVVLLPGHLSCSVLLQVAP